MKDYLYLQLPAIESHFGYDYENRQSCECETSQKITRCLFDSVLIIQFVTLFGYSALVEINRRLR